MKHYKHLTKRDRIKIETLYNQGKKNCEIAKILRVHESTISRELKRGLYIKRSTKLIEIAGYSCDLAQNRYENNLLAKGVSIKIGCDYKYAKFIEDKIADEHYSPAAVLGEIKRKDLSFKTSICVSTLYSYIEKDVFGRITNKDLPIKSTRKRKYNKVRERMHKRLLGNSIEDRNISVETRDDFGH
ncbi:MAG: helix-turn-helix domain-containing protein [Erysipelotrichaceae bacterium]|nr:helix-turn-helix domain-containing protein [Erysipelotrichaceae bacterium]